MAAPHDTPPAPPAATDSVADQSPWPQEQTAADTASYVSHAAGDDSESLSKPRRRRQSRAANFNGKRGSRLGTLNRTTVERQQFTIAMHEVVAETFHKLGGVPHMAKWARKHPTEFYRIAARLIPATLNANLSVDQGFADQLARAQERRQAAIRNAAGRAQTGGLSGAALAQVGAVIEGTAVEVREVLAPVKP